MRLAIRIVGPPLATVLVPPAASLSVLFVPWGGTPATAAATRVAPGPAAPGRTTSASSPAPRSGATCVVAAVIGHASAGWIAGLGRAWGFLPRRLVAEALATTPATASAAARGTLSVAATAVSLIALTGRGRGRCVRLAPAGASSPRSAAWSVGATACRHRLVVHEHS